MQDPKDRLVAALDEALFDFDSELREEGYPQHQARERIVRSALGEILARPLIALPTPDTFCPDCGRVGEGRGHQSCQYPR